MTSKLVQLVEEWDETTRFDKAESKALHELSREQLGERFGLDYSETHLFWYIIKEDEEHEYYAYGVDDKNAQVFLEQLQESIHQSFDGWSDYEKIVIRGYLADVTWATHQVIKDRA